jgi:beta-lactamase class D
MKRGLIILTFGLIFQTGFSQKSTEFDFKKHFDKYGVDGCFVLYNQSDNEFIKYNSNLCDSGYIPASTFKIPHALIALEEKVINDTNEIIKWNGHEWPHKVWNQDQTLITSMKYSCIWVYFGFAEKIGIDKYYDYVNKFDYGNKNLTGPPTRFWLAGQFRISANQQIDFLKRFYNYELPVSEKSIDKVKDIIILKQTDNYVFSGKTGGGRLSDSEDIMWLVGYVEKDNKPYFYALNYKT